MAEREYSILFSMNDLKGAQIHITGIVQGVGFRPFVYGLALHLELTGWVRNTSAGVDIEIDGRPDQIQAFIHKLENEIPPLARIDSIKIQNKPPNGYSNFEIVHSQPIPGAFIPISPDVSICDDCLHELLDPLNPRFRYPFINCTNCGPRFTIIKDIPYDRAKTTMAPFEMCDFCRSQYENPLDRRFHAQPVACPQCGPQVWLEKGFPSCSKAVETSESAARIYGDEAILETQKLLLQGKILAIKGLGGFHLACDAFNPTAVSELRLRKLRVDKPFALMMSDMDVVEHHCLVNPRERELLLSRQRPIVLLDRKQDSGVAPSVAPNQNTLGVMLPYTPLHYLLFSLSPYEDPTTNPLKALVMTSANLNEEPIAIDNEEARQRLSTLADAFLMHNRDIRTRCDDSVVCAVDWQSNDNLRTSPSLLNTVYPIRRSRGYAPNPIHISWEAPQVLATGSELKNTFCFTKGQYAFLSQHIGDMENYETLQSFEDSIKHYEKLFRLKPEAIAYDLHPNYLATRYALERAESEKLPSLGVQHHHAHIAACMAENDLGDEEPVIGVSFDGTGYGDDGAIWGGEFLIANYHSYQRFAHLEYFPLPGGDSAIRKPFRIALAQLWSQNILWDQDLPPVLSTCGDEMSMLSSMLKHQINTPQTSSIGRLFDSVAALSGVRQEINYEAQAAMEFETLVDREEKEVYPFPFESGILRIKPLLQSVIHDLRSHIPPQIISARFHNGLSNAIVNVCEFAHQQHAIKRVVLSGGVWQNLTLLRKTIPLLEKAGFDIFIHRQVPTNDGGLPLGQAAIAIHTLF